MPALQDKRVPRQVEGELLMLFSCSSLTFGSLLCLLELAMMSMFLLGLPSHALAPAFSSLVCTMHCKGTASASRPYLHAGSAELGLHRALS